MIAEHYITTGLAPILTRDLSRAERSRRRKIALIEVFQSVVLHNRHYLRFPTIDGCASQRHGAAPLRSRAGRRAAEATPTCNMQPSIPIPPDGPPSPQSPGQCFPPQSHTSSNTPQSARSPLCSDGDNSSAPRSPPARSFRAAANAVIARRRIESIVSDRERGLHPDTLATFVTRLCVPQENYLVEIAVPVLQSLGKKMTEHEMETMKSFARDILKPYCSEMYQGVSVFTLLAFALYFSENRTDLSSEGRSLDWSEMHEIYGRFDSFTPEVLEWVRVNNALHHVHAFCEDDFRYGAILEKLNRTPKSFGWQKRIYNLEPERGRYYGKTPLIYVCMTYFVLLITIALTVNFFIASSEYTLEYLQLLPLVDLLYFGIWKVFSYNDKIVRDLLTRRWTIASVEDFQTYFNISASEMSQRLLGNDSELGKLLCPRFTSYSSVPLMGFLSFSKPCRSTVFRGNILYFIVSDAEYVVDILNGRVGFFPAITAGVGVITWIFKKGVGNTNPTLPPRRRQTQTHCLSTKTTTLVVEKNLHDVCDYLG